MLHRMVVTFAIFVAAGCSAGIGQSFARADFMDDSACGGLNNTFACARRIESLLLARAGGRIRRVGDTLYVRLDNGRATTLVDEKHQVILRRFEPASYSYFGRLPRTPFLLFHAQYGEGNDFAVMHGGSGRVSFVNGYPQVSPDGRSALVAEDGYFNSIGVFVYETRQDSLAQVFAIENQDWTPGCAAWVTDTQAWVEQRLTNELFPDSSRVLGKVTLRRNAGAWSASSR
jgi:hypothetical protein